jgi:UDP-glucuronate 4-epimerase
MAFRRFCEAATRGAPIELFGDGRQSRDFTFVADVIDAVRAAGSGAGASGRAYNVGGGAPISMNAALERLALLAGRPLDVHRSGHQAGDVTHTAADVARAREDLDFSPATSLDDGLRAELDWVVAHDRAADAA